MDKRFIEQNLNSKDMSHFSTNEKNNRYGHRSSHSIWWARRPLAERMRGLIMYYKMEEEE